MATPLPQLARAALEDRVLDVVRALVAELGNSSGASRVRRGAQIERELGLGSLERVELMLRLESAFGVRLNEQIVAESETVDDVAAAVETALGSGCGAEARLAEFDRVAQRAPTVPSEHGLAQGFPDAETFDEVLRWRARADAGRTHLILYGDTQAETSSVTFGELVEAGERVAANFAQRGIGRGDTVAIMLPTSREFFFTFAGILLAGATPVPIYPPFRADRIEQYAARQAAILSNAGARLLVTFREAAGVAKLLKPRVKSLEGVVTAESLAAARAPMRSGRAENSPAPPGVTPRPRGSDLALLQYTSGSTGDPKGVMLTHANLLANIRAIGEVIGIRNNDVGVSWLPLYHDMGLIGAWLLPLYFGLPLVVFSPLAFLSRPERWLRAVHRYRGTLGAAPNFAYEFATAKIPDRELEGLDLSSWRAALNGAEPVNPGTLDRFATRFAACGLRREALLPVYGLAEASLALTIPPMERAARVDHVDRAAFERKGRAVPAAAHAAATSADVISFVSVGRVIPRHEVRIVGDAGADAGERVEGKLWFRGPSATRGYYRNPAATQALFPEGEAAGWVDSGDRAYRADEEIFITGRVKDIIIHTGRNLYPHEIEDVATQVTGVRKGCVVAFGAPDEATGTERLVVVAETRERDSAARARIVEEINARVADAVGMPPETVELLPPHAIPKTSSGKLQRDATRKLFLAHALSAGAAPAWLQIARLAAGSSAGRASAALRRGLERVYGVYALALFGVFLVPAWVGVRIAPGRKSAAWITTSTIRALFAVAGLRIRVEGRENWRPDESRVIVANHSSYADVLVVMGALGTDYHFVAKSEVGSLPFIGAFLRKLGHFAFRREDPRARLEQAAQIEDSLRRGESVFVFPEGTFTPQPGVRPFQLGAFKAALAASRPVVPVAICGTRRLLRDATWLPRPAQITIRIFPPLTPSASAANSDWHEIVRLRDAARAAIAAAADEPLL